ncbi:MAG: hypothetical protein ABUK01_10370 [Leptospirales bacterium]
MKKRIILLIIGVMLLSSSCKAEHNLQLSIKADKKNYSSGNLIKIEYTFTNTGKDSLYLSIYDIEHRLKENTFLELSKDVRLQLKDWTKRKMPIVTEDNFILLESGKQYKMEVVFETILKNDDSWRYLQTSKKYSWRTGDTQIKKGTYKIGCIFQNNGDDFEKLIHKDKIMRHVDSGASNVWTGIVSSNTIDITIK